MPYTTVISTARNLVRIFARQGGDKTVYPTYMIDYALIRAANELIREAHLLLRTDAETTVAGTASYAVTDADFRPDRIDSAYLTGDNVVVTMADPVDEALYVRGGIVGPCLATRSTARLAIVDYTDLNDYAIANPATGQPVMMAFLDDGTYKLWPTPDQVYTVNRRWSGFFTSWALGLPLVSFTRTAGVLSAVVVQDSSDNQGASMTAAWSDTGGGSGATATATMANGTLASVAVGAGGTNYTAATQLLLNGYNANNQTFNLPDDYLYEIISLGAPAFLQQNDPEMAYATEKGQEFRAFVQRIRGAIGGLGVKKVIRRG